MFDQTIYETAYFTSNLESMLDIISRIFNINYEEDQPGDYFINREFRNQYSN